MVVSRLTWKLAMAPLPDAAFRLCSTTRYAAASSSWATSACRTRPSTGPTTSGTPSSRWGQHHLSGGLLVGFQLRRRPNRHERNQSADVDDRLAVPSSRNGSGRHFGDRREQRRSVLPSHAWYRHVRFLLGHALRLEGAEPLLIWSYSARRRRLDAANVIARRSIKFAEAEAVRSAA